MPSYRHTQFGWAILTPILLVILVVASICRRAPAGPIVSLLAAGLFLVVAALFFNLTVQLHPGWLECRFGVGLIRRRIRLADIREVRAVRNRWWYGWGIRLTPHGWLWNVSGLDAVELTFTDGRRFRIGTDDPDALLAALRPALSSAES